MLREPRGWLVPMAYATLLASAVGIFLVPQLLSPTMDTTGIFGRFLVGMVATIQAFALVIFAPLVGAATIAGERERGTWLSLLGSSVPRHQIATGKIAAACLYVLVLLAVSAPMAGLAVLLGAIDLGTIAGLYLAHAVVGCALACLGVAISTLFQRTWTAALAAIATAGALSVFSGTLYIAGAAVLAQLSTTPDPMALNWLLWFNPGYGMFLFFAGDTDPHALTSWWGHFGAMASLGGASFVVTVARLRRLRD